MRLIHAKGFSDSERQQWKVTIFNNLLHAFQVIFGAMEEQEVDFADQDNIVRLTTFTNRPALIHSSDMQRSWQQIQRSLPTKQCLRIVFRHSKAFGKMQVSNLPSRRATNMLFTTISHSMSLDADLLSFD